MLYESRTLASITNSSDKVKRLPIYFVIGSEQTLSKTDFKETGKKLMYVEG